MIKTKNYVLQLVENVKINITCVKTENGIKIHSNKINMFTDTKDIREITKSGRISEAKQLLIVVLELWIDTNSQYYKKFFSESFNIIFNRHSDWVSALATLVATNVSLLNISNLKDGLN